MHAKHPGQAHPALGCGREIFKLLISCDRGQRQRWSTRKTPPKRGKFVQVRRNSQDSWGSGGGTG
jgi:hypothetical protein